MKKSILAVVSVIIISVSFQSLSATAIGEVQKINPLKKEVVVWIRNRNQLLSMGDKLAVVVNNRVIQMKITNPMGTVAKCKLVGNDAKSIRMLQKGMAVYYYKQGIEKELFGKTSEKTSLNSNERKLAIKIDPPEAKLYIDGKKIEHKNNQELKLQEKDENEYEIKIKKFGYDDLKQNIEVKPGEIREVSYNLQKDTTSYVIIDGFSAGVEYGNNGLVYFGKCVGFKISFNYWGLGFTTVRFDNEKATVMPVELFYPLFDIDFEYVPVLFSLNYEINWCNARSEEDADGNSEFVWSFSPEHIFKLNCYFGMRYKNGRRNYISSIYAAYSISSEQQKYYVGASAGFGGLIGF